MKPKKLLKSKTSKPAASAKVRANPGKGKTTKAKAGNRAVRVKRKITKPTKQKRSQKRRTRVIKSASPTIPEVSVKIPTSAELVEPDGYSVIVVKQQALMNVTFAEAMQARPLLREVSGQEKAALINALISHTGDLMAFALNGAAVVMEHGSYAIRFTEAGARLLNAKELKFMTDAAGRRLPTLLSASGQVSENARLLGPLAKGTRVAANLSIAIVTTAHLISGHENAKRLHTIGEKVDFLIAAHRIEQLARIEAVYRQAKEILHLPQTEHTRRDLHRLGIDLFEVRSAWRQEILYHLNTAQKTEESQNKVVNWFQGWFRKGKDEKVTSSVSRSETEIQLINGSFAIHLALAQAAGTLDTFLRVSLKDELDELKRVRQAMQDRGSWIHDKHPELKTQVRESCEKLDAICQLYGSMVMPTETECGPDPSNSDTSPFRIQAK